ncbi:VOC family protein [Epilithonimonas hungarica]|uniref:Catechol 2,3-dioxygenase n=1 Tax=Epilithonimonas hungarica TaxID=454006 RepID=A0A1G7HPB4_9FLAO|nr:VOC family protein [Epilithonimonas hungarica]SDF02273.1 Catechol 2,3-dioxygenase [Epilithonimonas hungarica]
MKTFFTLMVFLPIVLFSQESNSKDPNKNKLSLGAFSVSLNVKNLAKSKEFYEKLGFSQMGGDIKHRYVIMKNGTVLIGLFEGMFEGNILTFNPGWDENAKEVDPFTDVRDIQKKLKNDQIQFNTEADEKSKGPAYIEFTDPDGNKILVDQHR